jgi:hypothetical protein
MQDYSFRKKNGAAKVKEFALCSTYADSSTQGRRHAKSAASG